MDFLLFIGVGAFVAIILGCLWASIYNMYIGTEPVSARTTWAGKKK